MTAAPNPLPFTPTQGDHPIGCWREPGHHGCAIAVLDHIGMRSGEDLRAVECSLSVWGHVLDAPQASLPGVTR